MSPPVTIVVHGAFHTTPVRCLVKTECRAWANGRARRCPTGRRWCLRCTSRRTSLSRSPGLPVWLRYSWKQSRPLRPHYSHQYPPLPPLLPPPLFPLLDVVSPCVLASGEHPATATDKTIRNATNSRIAFIVISSERGFARCRMPFEPSPFLEPDSRSIANPDKRFPLYVRRPSHFHTRAPAASSRRSRAPHAPLPGNGVLATA